VDTTGDDGVVLEVTSKCDLDSLVAKGKVVVLEVRSLSSPASEAFEPKFHSMAADFTDRAVFAKCVYPAARPLPAPLTLHPLARYLCK
jgi:hypothetical protein